MIKHYGIHEVNRYINWSYFFHAWGFQPRDMQSPEATQLLQEARQMLTLLNEKQGGALKAVSGMPTLQFSLTAVMELVHEGLLSIEQLVQKMCHAPATLYQIEKRGFIRPGYKADIVLLNPTKEWTVTNDCILSKCGWSPMEGETFHSKVEKTFVNGNLVYDNCQVDTQHRGQALRFDR